MKDTVNIVKVDPTHYEVTRTISEKINRANLEDRLKNLDIAEEQTLDQLEAIRQNKATILAALEDGAAEGKGKVVNLKKGE